MKYSVLDSNFDFNSQNGIITTILGNGERTLNIKAQFKIDGDTEIISVSNNDDLMEILVNKQECLNFSKIIDNYFATFKNYYEQITEFEKNTFQNPYDYHQEMLENIKNGN